MKPIRLAVTLGVFTFLMGPINAQATTARLASLPELIQMSDVIVVGEVLERESLWIGTRIYTRHRIAIEESWRGEHKAGDTIEVLTLGGVAAGLGQYVAGAAKLPLQSRAVLYLGRGDIRAGAYHPVGMWQGVFALDKDETGRVHRPSPPVRIVGPTPTSPPGNLIEMRKAVKETLSAQ